MAEPDSRAIREAFTDDDFESAFNQFTDSQYLYFPDYNNLSYTSGIVRFDTLATRDQFVIWSDSYLSIPIQVASSNTAYTAFDPIALKTSVLSLISSIQINSGSGQTIVNDISTQYINNIRLLLESSFDAQYSNLQDIQFWKDQYLPAQGGTNSGSWSTGVYNGNVPAPVTVPTGNGTAAELLPLTDPWQFGLSSGNANSALALTQANAQNPLYNAGMDMRVRWFKEASRFAVAAAGTYDFVANIPLGLLHPFLRQLNFPLINARFQLNFTTPIQGSAGALATMPQNQPFVVGLTDLNRGVAASQIRVAPPQAAIAPASNGAGSLNNCRIYYRKVTYSPELNTKLNAKLQSGYKKNIEYPVTDVYPGVLTAGQANNTSVTTVLVSSATVAPLRVYMLCMPTQENASSVIPMIFPIDHTNLNCIVNNTPYFYNDWQTDYDGWKYLKENTVAHGYEQTLGATIGFTDYQSQYHIVMFDVHRLKDRLAAPNEAVNIQVKFQRVASTNWPTTVAVDYLFLVERNQVAQFNISSSEVAIAVGSSAV